MSIASAIATKQQQVADAYTAVSAKGGTLPATQNLTNLATAIGTISGGGGGGETKYGTDINFYIGDPDANGVLQTPTPSQDADIVFTGVQNIGSSVLLDKFKNNSKVKTVSFPDLTTLTYQYGLRYAFQNCSNLTSVSFPALTTIPNNGYICENAFNSCSSLTSISMPELTTVTGNDAMRNMFSYCSALTSVSFPKLEKISCQQGWNQIFNSCTNLTSVSFPALTTLGQWQCCYQMFYGCRSLTSVTFPVLNKMNDVNGEGVLRQAFQNCTSLQSLYFPALDEHSFDGEFQTQFNNMLSGCSGVTVHFPYIIKSVVQNWSDVVAGFGGNGTIVSYDIDAGTLNINAPITTPTYISVDGETFYNQENYGNVGTVGNITISSSGDVTGFSTTDYLNSNINVGQIQGEDPSNNYFEMAFTTGSDVSTKQIIALGWPADYSSKYAIGIYNGKLLSNYVSSTSTISNSSISPNTKYWLRLYPCTGGWESYWTISISTDGVNWTDYTNKLYARNLYGTSFGMSRSGYSDYSSFYGTVHLEDCKIVKAGSVVWTPKVAAQSEFSLTTLGVKRVKMYFPDINTVSYENTSDVQKNTTATFNVSTPSTTTTLTVAISNDPGTISTITFLLDDIEVPVTGAGGTFQLNVNCISGDTIGYKVAATSTTAETTGTITLTGSAQSETITLGSL